MDSEPHYTNISELQASTPNHILTCEEYYSLKEKDIEIYKDVDDFLIDANMNYLDSQGLVLNDDNPEKRVKVVSQSIDKKGFPMAFFIQAHPIIEKLDDLTPEARRNSYKISSGGDLCVVIPTNREWAGKEVLAVETDGPPVGFRREVSYRQINDVAWGLKVRHVFMGGINLRDLVFFPKKMFDKFNLIDDGPDTFNELKNKESEWKTKKENGCENVSREMNNISNGSKFNEINKEYEERQKAKKIEAKHEEEKSKTVNKMTVTEEDKKKTVADTQSKDTKNYTPYIVPTVGCFVLEEAFRNLVFGNTQKTDYYLKDSEIE